MIIKQIMTSKIIVKYKIKRYKGNNFSLWKMRMKAILRKDNCLTTIEERLTEITDNAKWIEMDGNAITNIYLALAYEVLLSTAKNKTLLVREQLEISLLIRINTSHTLSQILYKIYRIPLIHWCLSHFGFLVLLYLSVEHVVHLFLHCHHSWRL